jgi:predicted ArsR family transcriptional regulator
MDATCNGPATRPLSAPRGPVGRTEILGLVQQAPTGVTTAEVAAKTGLRPSTVRSHLDHLVGAGLLVKARANSGLPYRPAWRYRPAGTDPAPTIYRFLLAAVLQQLATTGDDARADAGEIGSRWGRLLAGEHRPRTALMHVLQALGFTPREMASGGADTEIHLFTCPYLELVRRHPDAMCGIHAGIIRGVRQRTGHPDGSVRLEPFGAPGACVVRFRAPRPRAGEGPRPAGASDGERSR